MISPHDSIERYIEKYIEMLLENPLGQFPILAAIDGGCGAGKTTLAMRLSEYFGEQCAVVHMDDFFLRPEQRTEERFRTPGANVDYERVLEEVLLPLKRGNCCIYRPFSCKSMTLMEEVRIEEKRLVIVEGVYSCHPALWDCMNGHIFLNIDKKRQRQRIIARNGETAAKQFFERWIPLEDEYFEAYSIQRRCELCVEV